MGVQEKKSEVSPPIVFGVIAYIMDEFTICKVIQPIGG